MADRAQMVKRQRMLADFGEFALRNDDLDAVLAEACRLVAEVLETPFAKVLELLDDRQELLVKAGVGWKPGIVGQRRLPMGERSSETYAINEAEPLISKDIRKEDRFEFADFLKEHGVAALVNVPIFLPGGRPYGLLQVDDRQPRDFAEEDIEFLRTYATILGPVIDRLHKVSDLQAALDANRHLLQELQHRVKNHIGIITSFVLLRAKATASEEARAELGVIGERVETLRLVHEQLYAAGSAQRLPLRPYLVRLIENLVRLHQGHSGEVKLDFAIEEVELSPDVAVPVGLIVNEFVTNSLKYAFDGRGGTIRICVDTPENDIIRVRISDDGKGLPAEPRRPARGSGTGMTLIERLAQQIGTEPDWTSASGTMLRFEFAAR
jgi:two-component sensor histidine kinase